MNFELGICYDHDTCQFFPINHPYRMYPIRVHLQRCRVVRALFATN